MSVIRRLTAVALGLVCVVPLLAQSPDRRLTRDSGVESGRRVALVVGINSYMSAPLKNAVADARAVAAALRTLSFEVTLVENANRAVLIGAVSDFADGLRSTDVALFFFAGHGVQLGGENFLIPVDFGASSVTAARLNSLGAAAVQELLAKAKVALIVLDACRNNPFGGQRAAGGGLAAMEAKGTLVAFATGAGQTASDNTAAGNGLFTQELLRALTQPGLSVREVFYRVRQRVNDVSNGSQVPAVYDGLLGDFTFRPTSAGITAPVPAVPAGVGSDDTDRRVELSLWEAIKDTQSRRLFEDYLRQFPNGRFRTVAEERLNAIAATEVESRRHEAEEASKRRVGTATDQGRRGSDLIKAEKWSEAVELLKEAVAVIPDNPLWHTNLGIAYDRQRKYAEAEAPFRAAVRLEPTSGQHHYNLGLTLERLSKYDEAAREYERAVSISPNDAGWRSAYGSLLRFNLRKYAEAEVQYREAIRLEPSKASHHANLAGMLNLVNRIKEAEGEYREAIRLEPAGAGFHFGLGGILNVAGRFKEAEASYREAIRLAPTSFGYRTSLAFLFNTQGMWDAADAEYRQATALDQQTLNTRIAFANYLIGQDRFDDALNVLLEAQQTLPRTAGYHYQVARAYRGLGKWSEAETNYRAALTTDTGKFWFYPSYFAEFLRERGRFAEAETEGRDAIGLATSTAVQIARFELGLTLRAAGRQADAEREFATAVAEVRALPAHGDGYKFDLANRMLRNGVQVPDAVQLLKDAINSTYPDQLGTYHSALGWGLYKMEDLRSADDILRKAIARRETGEKYDRLGEVLAKLGRQAEARRAWERALALTPPKAKAATEIRVKLAALGKANQG